jgi:hypothetical protein
MCVCVCVHLAQTLHPVPFREVEVLSGAFVPLIKGTTHDALKCDISVGMEGGLRACTAVKEKMQSIPELRPLVLVLKLVLKERGLNEVFTGGLSSYAIFHLVLSFLQSQSSGQGTGNERMRPGHAASHRLVNAAPSSSPFPYFEKKEVGGASEGGRNASAGRQEIDEQTEAVGRRGAACAGEEGARDMGRLLVEICELYGGRYERGRDAVCCRRGVVPRVCVQYSQMWGPPPQLHLPLLPTTSACTRPYRQPAHQVLQSPCVCTCSDMRGGEQGSRRRWCFDREEVRAGVNAAGAPAAPQPLRRRRRPQAHCHRR